jgi:hypothetical protein
VQQIAIVSSSVALPKSDEDVHVGKSTFAAMALARQTAHEALKPMN